MFSFRDLHELAAHPTRPENTVLTVYLAQGPDRESVLNTLVADIARRITDIQETREFHSAATRVKQYVSVAPAGRNLVVVCDETDGSFWTAEVAFDVENAARWNCEPFLQPLIAAVD